ncbi:hypothetical protein [Massilia soli]|uniref:DUF1090 family protein n=1 Tax=Massilia soli TaxID=2792854 RepID=A0ABS7SKK2_9BURK|nr:hypothetical protein [Massilia soli]MBZ2206464.1 hypothetical protein [Massilia soli]
MKLTLLLVLLSALMGQSHAGGKLPGDVESFVSRREGCDHMRGEVPEPAQKARMREVQREIRRLCTGTDKQLNKLKKKYADEPRVMATLNEFEPDMENSK